MCVEDPFSQIRSHMRMCVDSYGRAPIDSQFSIRVPVLGQCVAPRDPSGKITCYDYHLLYHEMAFKIKHKVTRARASDLTKKVVNHGRQCW